MGDVDEARIDEAVRLLAAPGKALIIVGADGLLEEGLAAAGRIAAATGADLLAPTHCGRIERGAGRVDIARIPYPVDQALGRLRDYDTVILAGANDPVAFFAYPGKPSRLLPERRKSIVLRVARIMLRTRCNASPTASHRPARRQWFNLARGSKQPVARFHPK